MGVIAFLHCYLPLECVRDAWYVQICLLQEITVSCHSANFSYHLLMVREIGSNTPLHLRGKFGNGFYFYFTYNLLIFQLFGKQWTFFGKKEVSMYIDLIKP